MWFVLGVLVALLAMSTLYSIQRTATLAEAIRENQKSGRAVLDRVNDCTTPGRRCFDQGQKRTANAVGDITQASIYASYCAAREPGQTVAEIQRCVMRQFAIKRRP